MHSTEIFKVLVANRGEIACRIQAACSKLGLGAVSVFTDVDALSKHVLLAKESVCLGSSPKEYLNSEKLIEIAVSTGCQAVAPGYGFLSENTDFAEKCENHGIIFLGPTAETMGMFAQKHTARALAEQAEVPILPGSDLLTSEEDAVARAEQIGVPVLLKATGGGGGIGIHICRTLEEVRSNFVSAARQGQAAFGDAGVFVEKYVQRARHIEVQIFGDGQGAVVAFPERECSIQRRHQKILEESPSSFVTQDLRARLQQAAVRLGQLAKYRSAGTVEFIVDDETGEFYFLEVNTRLQVEHGITEMVSGVDLVAWQLELQGAAPQGNLPSDLAAYRPPMKGHAIEVRICAEDPAHDYRPCTGTLGLVSFPNVRVDTWVETGVEVSAYYDSLLAKLMVYGRDRQEAISKLQTALASTQLKGVTTNLEYLRLIAAAPALAEGQTTTKFVEGLDYAPPAVEVLEPGLLTTVQDYPGRVAMWSVGVPPSGPMDDYSHRLANALVGNNEKEAALEITLTGPILQFHTKCVLAVCGAEADVTVDGSPVPMWTSFIVGRGQTLKIGAVHGGSEGGSRAYLAFAGGLDIPDYLGSKSTFPGGSLGGHQGRALRTGDMLFLLPADLGSRSVGAQIPDAWVPRFCGGDTCWEIGVLPGPQAEPDYFVPEDIEVFYSTAYKIHHNSNRLGIRMEGPRPKFARPDGGEGGSHPSNVHDHVYAIGTINYTGDMPIALMVDGPSLGGFVCPATITTTQLWKMGQVRPGDSVRFRKLSIEEAYVARFTIDHQVALVRNMALGKLDKAGALAELASFTVDVPAMPLTEAVLKVLPKSSSNPGTQIRMAGDRYVFLEYGAMELDLNLRVRIYELEKYLKNQRVEGLVETSPGVRSVMIEYDQRRLPLPRLLQILNEAEENMLPADNMVFNSRILHLPLAFNERWTHDAIDRYMRSIRSEAPYLPSNVEFIARNNGLEGDPIEAVRQVVMNASYMVLGLGDVYLGAPCAVPVDPRHRLVVPKYNPARTYTPEGGVGIGGCYMCIYPMSSPGGYQLVGRTLPIWNSYGRTGPFTATKPWLLRNFDQVRYYEVSEDELEKLRADFKNGRLALQIEETQFSMHEYNQMVASVHDEYEAMRVRQRAAMAEQNAIDAEQLLRLAAKTVELSDASGSLDLGSEDEYGSDGHHSVSAGVTGTVWEIKAKIGQAVKAGDTLMVLEAMKMEYAVTSPVDGIVRHVRFAASDMVQQGMPVCLVEAA